MVAKNMSVICPKKKLTTVGKAQTRQHGAWLYNSTAMLSKIEMLLVDLHFCQGAQCFELLL